MAIPNPEPTPPLATIWPPAPLHVAVPPPLFVSAEGIEVTQSGGCLVAVNKLVQWGLALELCMFTILLLSPWIRFWTSPFHRHILSGWLPYVLWSYQIGYPTYLLMLSMIVGVWCLFVFYLNAYGIVLNTNAKTVKANGKLRPMSKIEAVRITQGTANLMGHRYTIRLIWNSTKTIAPWRKALVGQEANTSILGAFKQEANAEKIAEAIAGLAGVPVQHQTR